MKTPLKPLDDALAELLAHAAALTDTESVSLFEAEGRVLAADVVSALQVPPHDNSAMDGYVLRSSDVAQAGTVLPLSQRIAAGHVGAPLAKGTAARIFTGAPIPEGADAVVMQEECAPLDGDRVQVNTVPRPGQCIRRSGEDILRGSVVLGASTRLGPAELGLAASVGMAELTVARRPRVALFSTGDELVMPGAVAPEQMREGRIYNSNRFFLRSLLQRLGCEVLDLGVVEDRLGATLAALTQAAERCDVIVTSGGVSVGEEDHVKPAVQQLGALDLWKIAIKPGKPFAFGHVRAGGRQAHFMGLPGNPVSSFITFVLLVRPFLLRLQGVREVAPQSVAVSADFDWLKADSRREFLRVRRAADGRLERYANQGSGVLTSVAWADGVVDNPPHTPIARGDVVRFIPWSELL